MAQSASRLSNFKLGLVHVNSSIRFLQTRDERIRLYENYLTKASLIQSTHPDSAAIYVRKSISEVALVKKVSLYAAFMMLASLEFGDGNIKEAEAQYKRALEEARQKETKLEVGSALLSLSGVYISLKDEKRGRKAHNEALRIFTEEENGHKVAKCYTHLGVYAKKFDKDTIAAINHFENARQLFLGMQDTVLYIITSWSLFKLQDFSRHEKLALLDEMRVASSSLGLHPYREKLLNNIHKSYAALNEYEWAYRTLKTIDSLRIIHSDTAIVRVAEKAKADANVFGMERLLVDKEDTISRVRSRFQVVVLILGVAVLIGAAVFAVQYMERQQAKIESQETLAALHMAESNQVQNMLSSQERTRKKIARHLHDDVSSSLASIKLYLELGLEKVNGEAGSVLAKAYDLTDSTMYDVRRISHQMMSGALDSRGLAGAIDDVLQTYRDVTDLDLTLINAVEDELVEPVIKLAAYRMVKESLHNTIKHADADKVEVQIETSSEQLIIVVHDDGKGFDSTQKYSGMGVENLKKRAEELGGLADVDSEPDKGTLVNIVLPLKSNKDEKN